MEHGEGEHAALRRECQEELGVEIVVGDRIGTDVDIADGRATLRVWTARIARGEPHATEHGELRWLGGDRLYDVDWLPADLPIVAALRPLLDA